MSTIGKNIKKYRELKGLTQKQVADMLGKSKNVISNWESGTNRPDAISIEKLLDIFQIDANTLLGWSDPKRIKNDAEELVDELLNDPKIKEMLPLIQQLSAEDMELAKSFIKRLVRKDEK